MLAFLRCKVLTRKRKEKEENRIIHSQTLQKTFAMVRIDRVKHLQTASFADLQTHSGYID